MFQGVGRYRMVVLTGTQQVGADIPDGEDRSGTLVVPGDRLENLLVTRGDGLFIPLAAWLKPKRILARLAIDHAKNQARRRVCAPTASSHSQNSGEPPVPQIPFPKNSNDHATDFPSGKVR